MAVFWGPKILVSILIVFFSSVFYVSTSITTEINSAFNFHSFFSSLVRSRHFSLLVFTLTLYGTEKSIIWHLLLFLSITIRLGVCVSITWSVWTDISCECHFLLLLVDIHTTFPLHRSQTYSTFPKVFSYQSNHVIAYTLSLPAWDIQQICGSVPSICPHILYLLSFCIVYHGIDCVPSDGLLCVANRSDSVSFTQLPLWFSY